MPQFFIEKDVVVGENIHLEGPDAKHIASVLRLHEGEKLLLSSGNGRSYMSELINVTPRHIEAKILFERPYRDKQKSPTLAQAIIQYEKTEWIFQKAVELGVPTILPFSSSRSVSRMVEGIQEKKLQRWNHIAREAAKQSGLPFLPSIEAPLSFDQLLKKFSSFHTILFFWEGEEKNDFSSLALHQFKHPVLMVIGPEGGFSSEEARRARDAGATSLSLGPQILRVETAAITAPSVCQYTLGNLSL